MSDAIAVVETGSPRAVARDDRAAGSITELLRIAVERGTPVAELKELVALHQQMSAQQARQDFLAAMAAFQSECPSIKKKSTANITTNGGGTYSYTYAELDEIAGVVNPLLAKHGLSYSWDTSVEKDTLTCVCTLSHVGGHSTTSKFTLPVDSKSAMSPQQKVGAALTFAQRRSLSAALGLTTTDSDTDATAVAAETINEDQAMALEDLVRETGANLEKFLALFKIDSIINLPAARYNRAVAVLEETQRRRIEKKRQEAAE